MVISNHSRVPVSFNPVGAVLVVNGHRLRPSSPETIRDLVDDQTSRQIRRHEALVQSAGPPTKTSVDHLEANVDLKTANDTDNGIETGTASGKIRGTVTHTEVDEAKLEKRRRGSSRLR